LSITSTPAATPQFLQKSGRLDPKKLEIAKAEFKKLKSAGIIRRSNRLGPLLCTWCPKKMDHGGFVAITADRT
jgi:hypothetical protein